MAFQFHKLAASSCLYRNLSIYPMLPVMSQCRGVKNYSGAHLPFSSFGNPHICGKFGQLRYRKARENSWSNKNHFNDLKLKVECDSRNLRALNGVYKHQTTSPLQAQMRNEVPFTQRSRNMFTVGNSVKLSVFSYENVGRRLFSGNPNQRSKMPSTSINATENVSMKGEEISEVKSPRKSFHASRKKRKLGSNPEAALKKSDSGTSKIVDKSVHVSKPNEPTSGGVKNDVQAGSSVSTVGESISNIQKSNPRAKKKHKPKTKEHTQGGSGTGAPSDATRAGGIEGVPQSEKIPNISKDERLSQSSNSIQLREKCLLPVDSPGLVHERSKNEISHSRRRRKPNKSNTVKNSDSISLEQSRSILSVATKARDPKGVSPPESKPSVIKIGQPSQTSDVIPVLEKSSPAAVSPGLVHDKTKKNIRNSKGHQKHKKNVTDKNSDKSALEQSRSVGGKVDSRRKTLSPLYPPSGKSVVVVESLAKAKVIQGYLGDKFEVLPSNGHVRVLASWMGSVRPDDDFSMVWGVPSAAWTHLKSIKVALDGAKNLILACDPDREGEAIAWHITEMLTQQDALHESITVTRVVFNEITESSIKSALQSPRNINMDLVHAYLARRALDYLIVFSMTPLLGKKLPGCLSAGRVEHAALALICDRETEINEYKPVEYWTVEAKFSKQTQVSLDKAFSFSSRLVDIGSGKLGKLSIGHSTEAKDIQEKINSTSFKVVGSKRTKPRKNPPMPFITSTLQQEAANKLHFSPSYTMELAKKLYEGVKLLNDKTTGLITYMRTDGLHISDAAAEDIRSLVLERYGQGFAPKSARKFFKKVKNAQEAHEAIRPTDIRRFPSMLAGVLDEDSLKLYTLVWSRTMACQMEPTVFDQIQIDIGGAGEAILLQATCSKVESPGYQAAYKDVESAAINYNLEDGNVSEEALKSLCTLKTGDPLHLGEVELKQHLTQSPPRYTEGSLIKKLEELGIGRSSTYATTIKILLDRNYVTVKNRAFYPDFRARMVSHFLSHHFSEVNDYSFTADMENELDNVSAGVTEWKGLMKDYWTRFSMYCSRAGSVETRKVEKMLEEAFGDFLFASLPDKSRTCPSCSDGTLIFKVSGHGTGYFIACDQHPTCKYIAKTLYGEEEEEEGTPEKSELFEEPKVIGLNPGSNEKIFLKKGPYGNYIQLGEDRKGYSPKRAHVSQMKDVDSITLEQALDLLSYPITLGNHPEDGQPIYLRLAGYGFSIRHRRTNAPVPKNMNPKSVTVEKAVKLLLGKDAKKCGRPKNMPKPEIYETV